MNRVLTAISSATVVALYLAALRYAVPAAQPGFMLGAAVVGLVAWLNGSLAGLIAIAILLPATGYIYQLPDAAGQTAGLFSPLHIALQIIAAVSLGHARRTVQASKSRQSDLELSNENLRQALANVQELGGLYNLCSQCKSIQDNDGSWQKVDHFLADQTKMEFSHCLCPACAKDFKLP